LHRLRERIMQNGDTHQKTKWNNFHGEGFL
jgi:hypothetical protein